MAVPRNRLSNARKNSKKAHQAKSPRALVACESCGAMRRQHYRCHACFTYAKRVVGNVPVDASEAS
jgi:large subunit ribosomal protein L32